MVQRHHGAGVPSGQLIGQFEKVISGRPQPEGGSPAAELLEHPSDRVLGFVGQVAGRGP